MGMDRPIKSTVLCRLQRSAGRHETGDGLHEEGEFVGYFFKTLGFAAFNKNRSAPLLIGRMELLASASPRPLVASREQFWIYAVGIPAVILLLGATWLRLRRLQRVKLTSVAPAPEQELEEWLRNGPAPSRSDPS